MVAMVDRTKRVWEYSGARQVVMIFEQKVGLVLPFAAAEGRGTY